MSTECHKTQCPAHNKTEPFCDELFCLYQLVKKSCAMHGIELEDNAEETIFEYLQTSYPACGFMNETQIAEDFNAFLDK